MSVSPPKLPVRRRQTPQREGDQNRSSTAEQSSGGESRRTLLSSEDRISYGFSFVIHAILLALLAIPVYQSLSSEPESFTTIVEANEFDNAVILDGPVGVDLVMPLPPAGGASGGIENQLLDDAMEMSGIAAINPGMGPIGIGDGAGPAGAGGDGSGGFSFRVAEPGNAVRVGSFSLWPWPIIGKNLDGGLMHGDPGSAPSVRQDYHIVIRVKAPDGRKKVALSDFSGEIMGTDSYYQKIPQDAYFFNTRGTLVSARTRRDIPVIDGVAELLIRVPGAVVPLIRDRITVRSKMLNETQTAELVFKPRD